jgi:hypothetical protein
VVPDPQFATQVHRVVPLAHTSGTTTHLRLEVQHDAGAQFPSHYAHSQTPRIRRAWQSFAGAMRRMEQRLGNGFALPLTRRGLKRVAQVVPERLHAPALDYARQRAAYQARLYDAAHTLVHHDCHPGNWFWREDMPGLLDWQLCRLGEGVGDVAYLLGTSLAPESLADQEDALLQVYAEALVANGGSLPGGISHLAQRYRVHLAYAFEAMLMTVAIGGFMPLSSSLELVKRTAAAVDRNGSLTTARMWQG